MKKKSKIECLDCCTLCTIQIRIQGGHMVEFCRRCDRRIGRVEFVE